MGTAIFTSPMQRQCTSLLSNKKSFPLLLLPRFDINTQYPFILSDMATEEQSSNDQAIASCKDRAARIASFIGVGNHIDVITGVHGTGIGMGGRLSIFVSNIEGQTTINILSQRSLGEHPFLIVDRGITGQPTVHSLKEGVTFRNASDLIESEKLAGLIEENYNDIEELNLSAYMLHLGIALTKLQEMLRKQ